MESDKIVSELLLCLFYAIAFQRCIYPPQFFKKTHKWGIPIMVCTNKEVKSYFSNAIKAIRCEWLKPSNTGLNEVSMHFVSSSGEVLEKWQFRFHRVLFDRIGELTEDAIRQNVRNAMRQIHSSVTFLPILEGDLAVKISVEESTTVALNTTIPDGWKYSKHACVPDCINGEFNEVRLDEQLVIIPQVSYKLPY